MRSAVCCALALVCCTAFSSAAPLFHDTAATAASAPAASTVLASFDSQTVGFYPNWQPLAGPYVFDEIEVSLRYFSNVPGLFDAANASMPASGLPLTLSAQKMTAPGVFPIFAEWFESSPQNFSSTLLQIDVRAWVVGLNSSNFFEYYAQALPSLLFFPCNTAQRMDFRGFTIDDITLTINVMNASNARYSQEGVLAFSIGVWGFPNAEDAEPVDRKELQPCEAFGGRVDPSLRDKAEAARLADFPASTAPVDPVAPLMFAPCLNDLGPGPIYQNLLAFDPSVSGSEHSVFSYGQGGPSWGIPSIAWSAANATIFMEDPGAIDTPLIWTVVTNGTNPTSNQGGFITDEYASWSQVGCIGYSDAQSSLFTLSLFAGLITRFAGGTVQSTQIPVDQSEWNISPIAPLGESVDGQGTLYPARCFWDPSQPDAPSFLVYISVNATAGCNPWSQLGRVDVLTGKVEPLKYTRPSLPYTGTFDWTANAEFRNAIVLDWKRQLLVEVLPWQNSVRTTNLNSGEIIVYPPFHASLVEAGGQYTTIDIAHGRLITNAGQQPGSAYFGLVLTIDYLVNGQLIWATAQGDYGYGYLPFGLLYPNDQN